MTIRLLISLTALLCLTADVVADSFPIPNFQVQYEVSRSGLTIGENSRTLSQQEDGRYIFESRTRTTGLVSMFVKDKVLEQSIWQFIDNKIIADQYRYQRTGGKKEKDIHLTFDWNKGRVINYIDQDPWVMPIPAGTMDKFIYQLQVMLDLSNNNKEMRYQIADGGKLKDFQLEVIGEEAIKTELGTLETTIIKRLNDKRQTTLWCAKKYHYLPVKITQIEKDGAEFKAMITRLSGIKSQ